MKQYLTIADIESMPQFMRGHIQHIHRDTLSRFPKSTLLHQAIGAYFYIPKDAEELGMIELVNPKGGYIALRDGPGIADDTAHIGDHRVLSMFNENLACINFWIPKKVAFMHPHMAETIKLTREALGA